MKKRSLATVLVVAFTFALASLTMAQSSTDQNSSNADNKPPHGILQTQIVDVEFIIE